MSGSVAEVVSGVGDKVGLGFPTRFGEVDLVAQPALGRLVAEVRFRVVRRVETHAGRGQVRRGAPAHRLTRSGRLVLMGPHGAQHLDALLAGRE